MGKRIDDMVIRAHRALKCRHYSLYDIRIDANEQPHILEAALFCSFSPLSVIPCMAQQAGREDLKHPQLFHSFLERACNSKKNQKVKGQGDVIFDALAQSPTMDALEDTPSDVSTDSLPSSDEAAWPS